MSKVKTQFVINSCGAVYSKWVGKCNKCGECNTVSECVAEVESGLKYTSTVAPVSLYDIKGLETECFKTGIGELDQVLGGGIVKGIVVLIGGEPGIGKSTVMLKVAEIIAKAHKKVIYVNGEESPEQIKLRADRIASSKENISILSTTTFEEVEASLAQDKFDYLIIDSIQTIASKELMSAGGAVGQVRYVTYRLIEIAKSTALTVFIVGQVTKDGNIAGPKVLEHLVDTVLYFEGDYSRGLRILHCVKNRFGSTDEVGIFEMSARGLVEAHNATFLNDGDEQASGKVICPIIEGSRAFLVENQALDVPTYFQYPKRNAQGYDSNRLAMHLAILDKTGGLNLTGADVYLNVAGGLKITETSADLAVFVALLSSFLDKPIDSTKSFKRA